MAVVPVRKENQALHDRPQVPPLAMANPYQTSHRRFNTSTRPGASTRSGGDSRYQVSAEFASSWAFVGRRKVLDQLETHYRQVLFGRRAGGLLLCGPEGIGKSTVALEFVRRLQKSKSSFRFIEAQPGERGLSLIRSLLYSRFSEELQSAQPAQSLVATLRRLVPTHEVVEVTVAVSDLIGVDLPGRHATLDWLRRLLADPSRRHPFLADILRRFLARELERQPLVMLLQSPNDADEESRAILGDVFASLTDQPLLVMAIQRESQLPASSQMMSLPPSQASGDETLADVPGLFSSGKNPFLDADTDVDPDATHADDMLSKLSGFLELADLDPDATQIVSQEAEPATMPDGNLLFGLPCELVELSPLTDGEMEGLVRSMLAHVGSVPEELVGMLLTDCRGVPGKLPQRIQGLVSHGVLEQTANGWQVRLERLMGRSLPSDLDSLAQARIRALPEKHKKCLEIAAIIGPIFTVPQVLSLMRLEPEKGETPFFENRTESRLRQVLLEAQGRDVVAYLAEESRGGAETFEFQLGRERELLANQVDTNRRRMMHRVLAQILERNGADPEIVAHHWREGNARRRAAITMIYAGISHFERFAAREAVECLESALTELEHDEGNILSDGLVALAEAFMMLGEYNRVPRVCGRLAQHAYAMGAEEYGAQSFLLEGRAARMRGDLSEAKSRLDLGLQLVEQAEATHDVMAVTAEILDELAGVRWQSGDGYNDSLELSRKALEIREALNDFEGMAKTLLNIGKIQYSEKRLKQAESCYKRAVTIANEHGLQDVLAKGYNALGVLAASSNAPDLAQRHWKKALEVSRTIGDRSLRANVLANLGELAWTRGEAGVATELLRRGADLARSIGDFRVSADAFRHLAQLSLENGEAHAAVSIAQQALDDARRSNNRWSVSMALRNLAEVLGQTVSGGTQSKSRQMDRFMPAVERVSLADQSFRESVSVLEGLGNRTDLVDTLASYRAFLIEQGRQSESELIARKLDRARR